MDIRDENLKWSEIYWTLLHKDNSISEFFDAPLTPQIRQAKKQEFFAELSDEEEFFEASASKSEGKYFNIAHLS